MYSQGMVSPFCAARGNPRIEGCVCILILGRYAPAAGPVKVSAGAVASPGRRGSFFCLSLQSKRVQSGLLQIRLDVMHGGKRLTRANVGESRGMGAPRSGLYYLRRACGRRFGP